MANYLATARRVMAAAGASEKPLNLVPDLPPVSDTRFDEAVRWAAVDILNRAGARQFHLDGRFTIAVWAAADLPEVRAAIATLHPAGVPVLHLEDSRVPERYRQYRPANLSGASAAARVLPGE